MTSGQGFLIHANMGPLTPCLRSLHNIFVAWLILSELIQRLVAFIPDISSRAAFQNGFEWRHRRTNNIYSPTNSELRGINEWRDTVFDIPGEGRSNIGIDDFAIPRQICVLPFPFDDVLLQGETKQLRLFEDRFVELFNTAMDKHNGMVAMGLIADSGIIQTIPICEIEAYNRMEGFGIFVTIRVVGRATLLELSQQEPFIKATCIEIVDKIPPNLDLPNMVANNIESFYATLSTLDSKLERKLMLGEDIDIATSKDERMRKLDLEGSLLGNEEGDDDDLDRYGQFNAAFLQAKASDSQGYMVSTKCNDEQRSVQDLTAISWSAFCTNDVGDMARIQALDCDDLFDRLRMGSHMLREKKAELEAKLALSDVKLLDDDEDD